MDEDGSRRGGFAVIPGQERRKGLEQRSLMQQALLRVLNPIAFDSGDAVAPRVLGGVKSVCAISRDCWCSSIVIGSGAPGKQAAKETGKGNPEPRAKRAAIPVPCPRGIGPGSIWLPYSTPRRPLSFTIP